jgi:hypothetical protein
MELDMGDIGPVAVIDEAARCMPVTLATSRYGPVDYVVEERGL